MSGTARSYRTSRRESVAMFPFSKRGPDLVQQIGSLE
jgi:hypothetical protein